MKKLLAILLTAMLLFAVGCPSPTDSGTDDTDDTTTVSVTSVSLNETDLTLAVTGTVQLIATVFPVDATDKDVTWSSSDTDVATVDNGLVTAVADGTAQITVTTEDGAKTAVATIDVDDSLTVVTPNSISMTTTEISFGIDETFQAEVEFNPEDTTNQSLTWTTADEAIATVSSTGLVTAVTSGDVVITATSVADNTLTATLAVTVKEMTASDYLNLGLSALFNEDVDTAIYYIDIAYDMDTDKLPEIALWKSLATLANTVISDEMQAIASSAGMTSYPTTINDLIWGDFAGEMVVLDDIDYDKYWDGSEWVPFVNYYEYNNYPEITLPSVTDFDDLLNDNDAGEGVDILNFNEYCIAILYNLGQAYPDGTTEPLEDMTTVISTAVAEVIALLEDVDTTTNITFTTDMLFPGLSEDDLEDMGWATQNGDYVGYTIGEAEFNALIGGFELINTLFTYSLSVTYNAELDSLTDLMIDLMESDNIDFNASGLVFPAYPLQDFLETADTAEITLAAAKESFSSALGHLSSAAEDIAARDSSVTDSPFAISYAELGPEIWSEMETPLEVAAEFMTLLKASVDTDATTLVVPFTEWDSAAVFGTYTETTISGSTLSALEINASALFDQSLLDPANIIEMDANREPVIYDFGTEGTDTPTAVTEKADLDENIYGLRIKDFTMGGLLVVESADVNGYASAMLGSGDMYHINVDNSIDVMGVVPAGLVWSTFNAMDQTTTDGDDGATIYGAGSFYWAIARNIHLFDFMMVSEETTNEIIME